MIVLFLVAAGAVVALVRAELHAHSVHHHVGWFPCKRVYACSADQCGNLA